MPGALYWSVRPRRSWICFILWYQTNELSEEIVFDDGSFKVESVTTWNERNQENYE